MDTWKARENEWLPYAKNDVSSTAFRYARYTMGMAKLTKFRMKNSWTLPNLANKYLNSLIDENDEPIYTYTEPFMKMFTRQSIKGGRCKAFNQHHKTEVSDNVLNVISKELDINVNIWEILEKYFEFSSKYENLYAKEIGLKYDEYRDIDQKEKTDFFSKKVNLLAVHEQLSKVDLNFTQMDFDATSLYPSCLWDNNSVFLKNKLDLLLNNRWVMFM